MTQDQRIIPGLRIDAMEGVMGGLSERPIMKRSESHIRGELTTKSMPHAVFGYKRVSFGAG